MLHWKCSGLTSGMKSGQRSKIKVNQVIRFYGHEVALLINNKLFLMIHLNITHINISVSKQPNMKLDWLLINLVEIFKVAVEDKKSCISWHRPINFQNFNFSG